MTNLQVGSDIGVGCGRKSTDHIPRIPVQALRPVIITLQQHKCYISLTNLKLLNVPELDHETTATAIERRRMKQWGTVWSDLVDVWYRPQIVGSHPAMAEWTGGSTGLYVSIAWASRHHRRGALWTDKCKETFLNELSLEVNNERGEHLNERSVPIAKRREFIIWNEDPKKMA